MWIYDKKFGKSTQQKLAIVVEEPKAIQTPS